MASVLSHNTGLQELNLQGNDLQSEGANVITKELRRISTLGMLHGISDDAIDI